MKISHVLTLSDNYMSIIQHDAQTSFYLSTKSNRIIKTDLQLDMGDWSNVSIHEKSDVGYDIDVSMLTAVNIIEELVVVAWLDGNTHRIALYPNQDDNLYDPSTPYRLYYAHDTRKLYQNIADTWQYVATQDHTNLLNAGNFTHDEIDDALSKISTFKEAQW